MENMYFFVLNQIKQLEVASSDHQWLFVASVLLQMVDSLLMY